MRPQFLLALLVALCLTWTGICPACAEGVDLSGIVARLAEQEIHVSDEQLAAFAEAYGEALAEMEENSHIPEEVKAGLRDYYASEGGLTSELLFFLGGGEYDYDTGAWTATSADVYAFDAEVYDIEHMYTLFLQGVQAIVPGIQISDIQEDFDWERLDYGTRGVSFTCNGTPYSVELVSQGDWLNSEIIDFMNDVLRQENCSGRLYSVTDDADQMVILLYGSYGRAVAVSELLGVR